MGAAAVPKTRIFEIFLQPTRAKPSKAEKDYVHRLALEYCARRDDKLGATIFSKLVAEEKEKDIAEYTGMNSKEIREYKKDIYNKLMLHMVETEENKSSKKEERIPSTYIINRFNPSSMINLEAYNLFVQEIDPFKASEIIKKYEKDNVPIISSINVESMRDIYSNILDYDLEMANRYITFIPGDTVIWISYKGPVIEPGSTRLPASGKLKILYIEIDEALDEEKI